METYNTSARPDTPAHELNETGGCCLYGLLNDGGEKEVHPNLFFVPAL